MEVLDDIALMSVVAELTCKDQLYNSASCSGTVIGSMANGHNLIVTSGLILKPLLNVNETHTDGSLEHFVFAGKTGIELEMFFKNCDVTVYAARQNESRVHGRNKTAICKQPAVIIAIWRVAAFDQVLDAVLSSSNGWSFTSKDSKQNVTSNSTSSSATSDGHLENIDANEEDLVRKLLSLFVLLRTSEPINSKGLKMTTESQVPLMLDQWKVNLNRFLLDNKSHKALQLPKDNTKETGNRGIVETLIRIHEALPMVMTQGTKVKLVSTPFGSLSPDVFLNSLSEGIVTNMAGKEEVLIMTDARCVPGCEGGAVYDAEPDLRCQLLGIIVAPFCWRQNEWVGLTFACSARQLISSLLQYLLDYPIRLPWPKTPESSLALMSKNIALVKVGSRWGSAVVIDSLSQREETLLLTCCHVVQKMVASNVTVNLSVGTFQRFHVKAVVLYSTPPDNVYDISVLSIKHLPVNQRLPVGLQLSGRFVHEGDQVRVIGHGLFDEHINIPPSVTSGIISKVLHKDDQQVQIQTTCAVHPGVSGGALLDAVTEELLGIVVCNTRDAVSEACYPHINLSIPSTILLPILSQYEKYGDVEVFQQLHEHDPIINNYWQLGHVRHSELKHKL